MFALAVAVVVEVASGGWWAVVALPVLAAGGAGAGGAGGAGDAEDDDNEPDVDDAAYELSC